MDDEKITAERLRQRLEQGDRLLLLDVRDPEKYAQGSLTHPRASAENWPYVEMIDENGKAGERLAAIPPGAEIVTVCTTGNKAGKAAAYLRGLGYSAVSLDGGLTKYNES